MAFKHKTPVQYVRKIFVVDESMCQLYLNIILVTVRNLPLVCVFAWVMRLLPIGSRLRTARSASFSLSI